MTAAEHEKILSWLLVFCGMHPPVHTVTAMILLSLYPDKVKTLREISDAYKGKKGALRVHVHRLAKNGVIRCDVRIVGGKCVGFYSLTRSGGLCVELWEKKTQRFYDAAARSHS